MKIGGGFSQNRFFMLVKDDDIDDDIGGGGGGGISTTTMSLVSNLIHRTSYSDLHGPALTIAGICVLVALSLSIFLMFQHLTSYTNPPEQKWIVAVVFMVPFYACESIISLWHPRLSVACDILRNCYEAFALYSFGSYLVACLGGERRVVELLDDESRKHLYEPLLEAYDENQELQNRSFRNFFLRPHVLGENLYTIVKFGLVQYMILKTLCSFLALLLELFGVYGDGEFKWYYGYPYIAAVLNFSQMWALYCLVQFYTMTHERLQQIKPLSKFISFKAIVFATWWQGVGIALLCAIGVLPKEGRIQNGLQDFLICVEMAVAAVAHVYVFSAKPYCYLTASEQGKVVSFQSKAKLKVKEDGKEKPAVAEQRGIRAEAPGTSISESVQDIVVGGGEHVVKDVVLTINQAMEPVEKGMTKIQERFHHVSVDSDKKEPKLEVEHVEKSIRGNESNLITSEEVISHNNENERFH